MSGSAVAGVSHDQSGRLPAISLRRQSVPGLPAAAAMHAQPEYGEGRDPTRVAGSERPGGCSSSGAARQEDLRTQERNGGTQLRRCQTAARASLRTHARLEERAPAVPAGSNGAEHQENRLLLSRLGPNLPPEQRLFLLRRLLVYATQLLAPSNR